MARTKTDLIIVHCSATPAGMDIGAKEIDRWHREKGWLKIGYHFVIRRDGTIEPGRDIDEVGAHAEGYNGRSVGICLVGGVAIDGKHSENNFTPAQFASLAKLLKSCLISYPDAKIIGHREVAPKDCPSFDVQEWLKKNPLD